MSRLLLAAGTLLIAAASAEAQPAWRSVPTPLPPQIHLSRVRPPYVGPVWRSWNSGISANTEPQTVRPVDTSVVVLEPEATAAAPPAVVEAAPPPVPAAPVAPVAPAVIVAAPEPSPVVAAKAPDPEPPTTTPAQPAVSPTPVVVAENASAPKPDALSAPTTLAQSRQTPWLDYIGAFVMAIVVAAAIFFLSRDRKRLA